MFKVLFLCKAPANNQCIASGDIVPIAYEHYLKVFESLPASYHSSYVTVSSNSSGRERYAYEINSPLNSFGPSTTNFAITCPGSSGLSKLPF